MARALGALNGCSPKNDPEWEVRGTLSPLPANVDTFAGEAGRTLSQTGGERPSVHYAPPNGWFGDAHPLYFNGKWYLYYLHLPKTTANRDELQGVKQGLVTSEDLTYWAEEPVSIDNGKMWFAIGNTVFEDQVYSLCGAMDENLSLTGGLGLSTSTDGHSFRWEGVVYSSTNCLADEMRDANVFYYEEEDVYILLHGGRNYRDANPNSQGAIYYATTKDFQTFSEEKLLYDPGNVSIPECPEMFRVGDKFYLSINWGISRTGTARYFVADSPYGPWRKTQINTFSSFGLVTPNTWTQDGKTVTFGWVPQYLGEVDGGRFQWGGEMGLPLELYHADDGETLWARPAFDSAGIRDGQLYDSGSGGVAYVKGDGWSRNEAGDLYHEAGAPYGDLAGSAGGELRHGTDLPNRRGQHRRGGSSQGGQRGFQRL